uniref:Neur_chan_memb domain-containing protein n=1 Tax=Macrostomum lignano TaxID=282301 RepID=A0A1I8I915_9PLAT
EMPDKPSRVFTSTFTDEQEWSLHTHVEASKTSVISDSQIGPRQRPAVQFSTRATRRATFYVVNIWFVSFILCMLALCVFGIDRQNLQGRLQLSFILLLTTVTFKFVIANHIPRVSYLTMLDKAVMHNLLFLVLLSIWHSVASLFPATHSLQANEKYAIIVFAGVYVLGICVILLQIVFGALRRKKLMDEKDLQYQVHLFSKAPQQAFPHGTKFPRLMRLKAARARDKKRSSPRLLETVLRSERQLASFARLHRLLCLSCSSSLLPLS